MAAQGLAQCPPTSAPRTWRVYPLYQAPAAIEAGGKTYQVPYFAEPYKTANGPCTLAINDDLMVVGTYMKEVGETGVPRPFVWLFTAEFGLSSGFHDLLDLTPGASSSEPGYANDITSDGLVVGGRGGLLETDDLYAFAWSLPGLLSGGGGISRPLDTASNGSISWSIAIAVEEAGGSNPKIVGLAGQDDCPTNWWPATFAVGSTTPTVFTSIAQPPDDDILQAPASSHMIHFTDVVHGEEPILNYEFASAKEPGECDIGIRSFDGCESAFIVGAQYRTGAAPTWLRFVPSGPTSIVEEQRLTCVRGIGADGLVVGSIKDYVSVEICRHFPALWDNPSGSVDYAESPTLPLPSGDTQAVVEGLNDAQSCTARRLVGWNLNGYHGVVWDQCSDDDPTEFSCSHRIDDIDGNPNSVVYQAFDLNEDGFMVVLVNGWAQVGSPPTSCVGADFVGVVIHRSDLNFDRVVNGADLAILLGAWGSGQCELSRANITGDGTVDGADLVVLLGDYSTGPVSPRWPCSADGCTESMAMSGEPSYELLDLALAALGFASQEKFIDWAITASEDELTSAMESIHAVLVSGGES